VTPGSVVYSQWIAFAISSMADGLQQTLSAGTPGEDGTASISVQRGVRFGQN